MNAVNLLQETIDDLAENGKTPDDVHWVGGSNQWFTWDEFSALADREYDDGFGRQEVACDLLIVGDSWWMNRSEYDGAERWVFHTKPERPKTHLSPMSLFGQTGWLSLSETV